MRRSILLYICLLAICAAKADNLQVSLITCWPGQEVYELYGHTALRIKGTEADGSPFDSVWNYGVFNYSDPNFIGRFVKGDLRYQVAGYPFHWFMPEYISAGRRVEEQTLALDSAAACRLRKALQINALPANRVYLYDYIKDNCSTRVFDKIEEAAGPLTLQSTHTYPNYRRAMKAYHSHYPWYSLGIDIALAQPVDTPISGRDPLFLPLELHDRMAGATLPDGSPAVASTQILNPGVADATLPPTPWYLTPLFWSWMLLLLSLIYCRFAIKRHSPLYWLEAIFFSLIGVAGCVIAFLVFCSIHRAAAPTLLLLWLNPLALVVPILIWSRHTRPIVAAYMIAQSLVLIFGAVMWPFQTQNGNPTFLPLILTELTLSATFIYLYFQSRKNTAA